MELWCKVHNSVLSNQYMLSWLTSRQLHHFVLCGQDGIASNGETRITSQRCQSKTLLGLKANSGGGAPSVGHKEFMPELSVDDVRGNRNSRPNRHPGAIYGSADSIGNAYEGCAGSTIYGFVAEIQTAASTEDVMFWRIPKRIRQGLVV